MRHIRFIALGGVFVLTLAASSLVIRSEQTPAPAAVTGDGPFDALHFRSIGPASMSGRIADIAVYEPNAAIFYVGSAHGGVWKTTNAGTTFEAQFQDQGLMSIGDIAVSQSNPDLVYVGTGESNNRQSTSWGDGVYKSTNGGKTYTNVGLRTSRHINRIVIDPRNNDVVLVAATGALFGAGGERGVYKTADGGRTWKQTLKVDDDTGANDLVMDATNSQILYASTYQRRRTACCMNGGGAGSGIWKSTDGGDTWTRLKGGVLNAPLGRIGLDIYRKRPNILYAVIEGETPPAGRGGAAAANAEQAPGGGGGGRSNIVTANDATPTGLYRTDDSGATWRKVNNANPRPMYFSQIRIDPNDPDTVIFGGVDLQMSTDGGKSVNTTAASKIHSDHHAIWIDPANSNHVMIGNDGGVAVSYDMAKTWNFLQNLPVGLFYHVSYDMATPFNVCGGMQDNYSWCGPSAVRGQAGIANYQWRTVQGGDGFVALQDPSDYRIAYSESQDGNMVRIDRVTGETISIRPLAAPGEPPLRWQWDTPLIQSPHDHKVLYAAANKIFRSADRGLTWVAISQDLTTNANREEIVTMGLKGSDIRIAKDDGIQSWPTTVSFAESPKKAGLLYAGTDDGNLQVTRDAGKTWTNVVSTIPNLPKGIWVSEVVPSRFDEGTVYATFDGHRQNDFGTYIYVSRDYGQTWQSAAANLNGEVIKTLTEDLKSPDVLYVGAETGLFVSTDRAKSWTRIKANLPTVRVDEITLHPRDNAMILATHGRALWILDHLEPIQEYAAVQATTTDAKLFAPPPSSTYRRPASDRNYEFWGDSAYFGENPPQAAVISWMNKKPLGEVKLKITDAAGREVREIAGPVMTAANKAGIQSACWDLRVQPAAAVAPAPARGSTSSPETAAGAGAMLGTTGESPAAQPSQQTQNQTESPFGAGCGAGGGRGGGGFGGGVSTAGPFVVAGTYTVALIVDGRTVDSKPLRVTGDPEVVLTEVQRKQMFDMAMEMHDFQRRATDLANAFAPLNRQVTELATAIAGRADLPADVKASFGAFQKDVTALAPKVNAPAAGRGGGGGRGNQDNLLTQIGTAKNGLMAGMSPTDQTMRGYADAKAKTTKAVADANALFARAATLSTTLAKYNLTLTAPPPLKAEPATAKKSSIK
jgi:photosystem II stability/assembly factor-like uncharacterized protein